jgi:AI-2 transport protein TqsA
MPFILLNPDLSGGMVLAILIITGIIQTLIGNILEPKLLGDSLELHPITILVTLVFWGMLWGVPGMFLATPLTAVVCILMNAFAPTRPFAQLLAGRGFQKAVID